MRLRRRAGEVRALSRRRHADPQVAALIRDKYIAVHVDQDARPDLANRYEDYGWPATIIFHMDGSELVKRRGYIPPKPMASLLQAVIDDPTPGARAGASTGPGNRGRHRPLAACCLRGKSPECCGGGWPAARDVSALAESHDEADRAFG